MVQQQLIIATICRSLTEAGTIFNRESSGGGSLAEVAGTYRCCSGFVLSSLKRHIMAKVLFTAVVADMRNKLNGTVFSKNRYGAYTRTKVTPVNPQTSFQSSVRSNFGTTSGAWRGLTQAQRNAWIAQAQFFPIIDIYGNSKILSGQALYQQLNRNLFTAGQSAISSPPSPVGIPSFFTVSITSVAAGADTVTANVATVPSGWTMIVSVTPGLTPGIGFAKNRFRILETGVLTTSAIIITTAYRARFGTPVVGNKIFARLYLINSTTGQMSVPAEVSTIVT
jgi:hypothetical protein